MDAQYIAALALSRDSARLDLVSQNIANTLTPGYKRQEQLNQAFGQLFNSYQTTAAAVPGGTRFVDMRAGAVTPTGNASDVTVQGSGFLGVEQAGGLAYTRNASLRIDVQGRLVTAAGDPVVGEQGGLVLNPGAFSVDGSGRVLQDGKMMGQLRLFHFDNVTKMNAAGAGLWLRGEAQPLVTVGASSRILPGFREASNVNTAQEMVAVTETLRHFEAMQKVFSGHDGMLDSAIRKLGEF